MNLIDLSGWFEYFIDSKNARHFIPVIEKIDELIVSPLNYFEIYKRVRSEFGRDEANRAVGFLKNARVVDVTTSIALEAAELSKVHHLHMADVFCWPPPNRKKPYCGQWMRISRTFPGCSIFQRNNSSVWSNNKRRP